MGYELKGDELNTLVSVSSSAIGGWLSALQQIRVQLERTIQSDAWGGQSGENIRYYLQEVHVEGLLPMLSDLLQDYAAKLALYDYGYSQIDSDIHKEFNEDAIREAKERYRPERLEECRDAFGEVLYAVGDILETVNPSIRDIENDCGRICYRLEHLMHEIGELEERTASWWTGPLEELAGALSQAVRAAISRPAGGVTGYTPGDAWKMSGMQEAYMRCVTTESSWRADRVLLGEAQAYETGVSQKLREEYEAQQAEEKKKKEKDAFGRMIGSGLMLLAGVAAVVGSAGTATPLVTGSFLAISGSTMMAFGLSDAMESTVQYAAGREDACNPLRELAFLGNEEAYRSVEMAAVMTAGFGGSMSASVSVEGVITKSGFARIVSGEAAGIVASVGIEEVGNRAGFSETERLLLNLGTGMAIGRLTERMPGWRKTGGSAGESSPVYKENFKKNAAAARADLDIRTRNAVEKNRIWIDEGGSETGNNIGEEYPLYRQKANTGEFSKLKEPMTIEHVKMVCEDGGVGYSGIKIKIVDDPELVGSGFLGYTHPGGQVVELYPDAFTNRETLLKTLGHERIHVMQNKLYGPPQDSITCGLFEDAAALSESDWWTYYKSVNGGY